MTTAERKLSLIFGMIFMALGVLGFMFGSKSMANEQLFGVLRVNLALNVLRIAFGIWGFAAVTSQKIAELFTQTAGVVHLVLALLGFFAPNGFGKLPIGGYNIALHALLGLALLFVGFSKGVPDDDLIIV